MKTSVRVLILLMGIAMAITWISCERETSPPNENLPPHTRMANIPRAGDTLFALLTLHWDGYDYDGFIAGYQYRYVTYHVGPGDSVVHDWRTTTESSLTIPFVSDSAPLLSILSRPSVA